MIYYLLFLIMAVIVDSNYLKSSNKKSDIAFYIIFMLIVLTIGIIYYTHTNFTGVSEYIIGIANLEVK